VPAVYTFNLTLAIALSLWPVWFSRRYLRLGWINPLTIVMAIDLPVQLMKILVGPWMLLDQGLFDSAFQYAILMNNILSAFQLAGLVFFFLLFQIIELERALPFKQLVLTQFDYRFGAVAFLLVYLGSLFLLATSEFGLINWLTNPRTGYQLYRVGNGHWYALAITGLSMAMLLSFLARPTVINVLLHTPVFLLLGYFLGSKYILLLIFSAALIQLWLLRWKHLVKVFLFGAPLVFILLVWNLFLALEDKFELASIIEYFDYFVRGADFYREVLTGKLELFFGEVFLTSFWSYVPRAIWPDKPFAYGIVLVNEIFFPGQAEETNTPAFSGAVEQYADFGILGVIFFGFFSSQFISTAAVTYLLYVKLGLQKMRHVSLGMVALMIVHLAPGFGLFFPGALYALLLVACVGSLWLMHALRQAFNLLRPAVSPRKGT
jgi:hypothetical protein